MEALVATVGGVSYALYTVCYSGGAAAVPAAAAGTGILVTKTVTVVVEVLPLVVQSVTTAGI